MWRFRFQIAAVLLLASCRPPSLKESVVDLGLDRDDSSDRPSVVSTPIATPTPAPTATPTPPASNANIILESDFESASGFSTWVKEVCRADSVTISTTVARKGKSSARFDFKKSDVLQYNNYVRAELHLDTPPQREYWYAFSHYLPADFVKDPLAEKFAQWHEIPDWDLGENWRSPPISLGIENDRYYLNVMWSADKVNTNDSAQQKRYDLGPVDRLKWNDWAIHIKFSHLSDGVLEIYKNKTRVVQHLGPNSFNDKYVPYFKLGIYKWGWNGWAEYSPENQRVTYFDEVRIGNSKATLNDVSPR